VQFEYRIVRPSDGTIRSLCDTAFPILDEHGAVARIGGITEDLTREDVRQVYIVCTRAAEARRLAGLVRTFGYRAQTFASGSAFLEIAPALAPGAVLVDLRNARAKGLSIPRELKARSMALPTIALDVETNVGDAVAAMKAGAADYVYWETMHPSALLSRTPWRNVTAHCGRPYPMRTPVPALLD
jgi:CheY-like chemotaxis protein